MIDLVTCSCGHPFAAHHDDGDCGAEQGFCQCREGVRVERARLRARVAELEEERQSAPWFSRCVSAEGRIAELEAERDDVDHACRVLREAMPSGCHLDDPERLPSRVLGVRR